jgi:hypothetical protein
MRDYKRKLKLATPIDEAILRPINLYDVPVAMAIKTQHGSVVKEFFLDSA